MCTMSYTRASRAVTTRGPCRAEDLLRVCDYESDWTEALLFCELQETAGQRNIATP